jgi:hypothetical protein
MGESSRAVFSSHDSGVFAEFVPWQVRPVFLRKAGLADERWK